MATYQRDLGSVFLSIFGIRIEGAGTDGMITVSFPKLMEHVDGQQGDAVGYKTGLRTATAEISLLQSATVNLDLLSVVNAAKTDPANGEGNFYLRDDNTGQYISGRCVLDGYPAQVAQNAEETNYVWALRIFDAEMDYV